MHDARAIIDALGGYRSVAHRLGIPDPKTVHNWLRGGRGIPARHWPQVVDLAAACGHAWITFDLLRNGTVASEAA